MLRLHSKESCLNYTLHPLEIEKSSTNSTRPAEVRSCVPVICFHGAGNATHYETWLPLVREMTKSTAVLYYDRQCCESTRRHQTPREAARDLELLLQRIQLKPPYILLAHSYGGTTAREFLQRHPEQVAGMVLAETGQETPTNHDQEQYRRQILGSKPLSVIHADSLRDMMMMRRGNVDVDSAEGRKARQLWAEEDERLKRAQLRLSSNARYVRVGDCGHNVVRDRPDVVAEEVKWVLDNVVCAREQGRRPFSRFARRAMELIFWRSK